MREKSKLRGSSLLEVILALSILAVVALGTRLFENRLAGRLSSSKIRFQAYEELQALPEDGLLSCNQTSNSQGRRIAFCVKQNGELNQSCQHAFLLEE